MTDVLIVCVREDEVQAKALADLFEREGMSVGGAPADEGSLKSSGAVVIIWSQASIRSRPFLDAAQRTVNAGKAVVACLIDAPPASSLNQSPCFDLKAWNGSADDPMVDPLYFAVDRMVNLARGVRPEAPRQPAYEPPPAAQAAPPPYARMRTTSAQPRYEPPPPRYEPPGFPQPAAQPSPRRAAAPPTPANDGADPVSAEALRWKAIRHSRDPAAFLHYLAEYGPDGAFSELAELRLKQLQDSTATPLKAAARAVAQDQQVQRRGAPAPEPTPLPAARREPPPAAAYRAAEPAPERDYRDYAPPRARRGASGGAGRVLLLVLILGGGALAGGWYLANGVRMNSAPETSIADAQPAQPVPEEETVATADPIDAPASPGGAIGGPVDESPDLTARSDVRPAPPAQRAEARQTESARAQAPRFEPLGGGSAPATALMPQPIAPAPTQLAAVEPSAIRPQVIVAPGQVVWVTRASAAQFGEAYPQGARRSNLAGRVQLQCVVQSDLRASCSILSETPQGYGFGDAALRVARSYRARPTLDDGASAIGARANLNITFRPQ